MGGDDATEEIGMKKWVWAFGISILLSVTAVWADGILDRRGQSNTVIVKTDKGTITSRDLHVWPKNGMIEVTLEDGTRCVVVAVLAQVHLPKTVAIDCDWMWR